MQRRRFIQALATVPVATALTVDAAATSPQGVQAGGTAEQTIQPLSYAVVDDVATPVRRFFDASQLAALERLADLLVPSTAETPGARECRAAEFLDFHLGRSPTARQLVYRNGVDALNGQARLRFGKGFAETSASEADAILEPLRRPWSYAPADPFEAFLRTASREIRVVSENSRIRAVSTGQVRTVNWLRPL